MKRFICSFIAVLIALPLFAQNVVEINANADRVRAELVRRFSSDGYAIASETASQVTFVRDFAAKNGALATIIFGQTLPQAYQARVQFMLAQTGENTSVAAAGEMYAQNGYGNVERSTADANFKVGIRKFLENVKATIEGKEDRISDAEFNASHPGKLTILVTSARSAEHPEYEAFYSPGITKKSAVFHGDDELRQFLVSELGLTSDQVRSRLQGLQQKRRLELPYLDWSKERLERLGLR
jgi:hypothetical protein